MQSIQFRTFKKIQIMQLVLETNDSVKKRTLPLGYSYDYFHAPLENSIYPIYAQNDLRCQSIVLSITFLFEVIRIFTNTSKNSLLVITLNIQTITQKTTTQHNMYTDFFQIGLYNNSRNIRLSFKSGSISSLHCTIDS